MNTYSVSEANQDVKIIKLPQPQISSLPALLVQPQSPYLTVSQSSRPRILNRMTLKLILPHHTLHRANSTIHILRIFFFVVVVRDITLHFKINQLPDRHTRINTHRLRT